MSNDPLVWPDEPESEPEDYRIDDDADIDRMLRWRRARVERIAAIVERADTLRAEIDEWERSTTEADRAAIRSLDETLIGEIHATGRRSFDSPFGRVSSRKGTPSLVINNEIGDIGEILDAVAAIDDTLLERKLRVADAKARLRPAHELDTENPDEAPAVNPATGEIIPGLVFTTKGRTWTVK